MNLSPYVNGKKLLINIFSVGVIIFTSVLPAQSLESKIEITNTSLDKINTMVKDYKKEPLPNCIQIEEGFKDRNEDLIIDKKYYKTIEDIKITGIDFNNNNSIDYEIFERTLPNGTKIKIERLLSPVYSSAAYDNPEDYVKKSRKTIIGKIKELQAGLNKYTIKNIESLIRTLSEDYDFYECRDFFIEIPLNDGTKKIYSGSNGSISNYYDIKKIIENREITETYEDNTNKKISQKIEEILPGGTKITTIYSCKSKNNSSKIIGKKIEKIVQGKKVIEEHDYSWNEMKRMTKKRVPCTSNIEVKIESYYHNKLVSTVLKKIVDGDIKTKIVHPAN